MIAVSLARASLEIVIGVAVASVGVGCKREARPFEGVHASHYGAGGPYGANAWGLSEGQRLYAQMNCQGCHAMGGGGMGPALMDEKWIYGFDDAAIFQTIANGRPHGMPPFRDRLSDNQIWQLVAYVKSLGGHAPKSAAAVRSDHMAVAPGPTRVDPEPVVVEAEP